MCRLMSFYTETGLQCRNTAAKADAISNCLRTSTWTLPVWMLSCSY